MRKSAIACAALSSALLLEACLGGGSRPATASVVPATAAVAAISPALAAAAYVAAAASLDLYEIRAAQLAMERSTDPANRAFAQHALAAHEGTSAQLSMAGRRLNLLPSATLMPDHQAMLDALTATSDFDNTYRAQQKILVRQGVALHGSYARNGDSPTLRPVAKNAEQVMRRSEQALPR